MQSDEDKDYFREKDRLMSSQVQIENAIRDLLIKNEGSLTRYQIALALNFPYTQTLAVLEEMVDRKRGHSGDGVLEIMRYIWTPSKSDKLREEEVRREMIEEEIANAEGARKASETRSETSREETLG